MEHVLFECVNINLCKARRKFEEGYCIHQYIYRQTSPNTEYAGPEISVNSRIVSLFSRQIANSHAGPTIALESMGAKPTFRCHFLNIGPSYKQ